MEKIHFKVQCIGTSIGHNTNKFVYHNLVRIWPKWDDTRNDEESIIVGLVHPDLIGTMAFNQNFAKMNKGDDAFDMKKYKEVPNMELRVNRNEILTLEYDSDSFDKNYSNQLWI